MSSIAMEWALKQEKLSAPKKLLLVTLAWVADDVGVTFKGQKTVGARMAKDPRWVREHLPELEERGLIQRHRRIRENGSRTSDLIVLNFPREEELDLTIYTGVVISVEGLAAETRRGVPAETHLSSGGNPPGHTNQPEDQPPSPDGEGEGASPQLVIASGPSEVETVFEEWVRATERDPARIKLTPDRRRVIRAALKRHGLAMCVTAVRNIGEDEWARGANDRGRRFDDVEHALSTAKRTEHWSERTGEKVKKQSDAEVLAGMWESLGGVKAPAGGAPAPRKELTA